MHFSRVYSLKLLGSVNRPDYSYRECSGTEKEVGQRSLGEKKTKATRIPMRIQSMVAYLLASTLGGRTGQLTMHTEHLDNRQSVEYRMA